MPTFTPETYGERIAPEKAEHADMWRHFGTPIKVGYSVLITGGTATTSPGTVSPTADDIAGADSGSGEGDKAWFRGGITYVVTSAEAAALAAAGYTVVGNGFDSGFDEGFG